MRPILSVYLIYNSVSLALFSIARKCNSHTNYLGLTFEQIDDMAEHTNLDAYYLGTVQIRSRNLEFKAHDTESDHCTGCYIQGIQHNLPALITIDEYRRMLVSNRISEDILYGIGFVPQIFLSERVKLPCLHGKLHLEFAKICDDGDYLWTQVDLYNSGKSSWSTCRRTLIIIVAASDMIYTLRQHYKQHVQVCDGEKYLHIRYLESTGQLQQAKRWRRSLGNKSRAMKQMLRCSWLNECLERLRPMRSLWHGLQIGSFPLILSWRCEQVLISFIISKTSNNEVGDHKLPTPNGRNVVWFYGQ